MEKFNLSWLAQAMTDPSGSNVHYFYDIKNHSFFYTKMPFYYNGGIEVYDIKGQEPSQEEYNDLFIRLANTSEDVIEIVRLNRAQKQDIQWQFLNRFCVHKYHFKYFLGVIDQKESDRFVLDKIIITENDRLFSLWESFKLEVIRIYANNFANRLGIELNLTV